VTDPARRARRVLLDLPESWQVRLVLWWLEHAPSGPALVDWLVARAVGDALSKKNT